jgi:hypothetical protein
VLAIPPRHYAYLPHYGRNFVYYTKQDQVVCARVCVCVCVLASVMTGGGGVKHYHSLKSVSPPTTSKQCIRSLRIAPYL